MLDAQCSVFHVLLLRVGESLSERLPELESGRAQHFQLEHFYIPIPLYAA